MGRHIGLVGPKHSGKTTAGNYLVSKGYVKIALADPLKDLAVQMLNTFHEDEGLPRINREFLDTHKDEVFVPFLQWLGSDYGRDFLHSPDRWINKFLKETYSSPQPIVCDDIRFPNEAETLHDNGFLIVKLVRLPSARKRSLTAAGVDPATADHQSETHIEKIVPDLMLYPGEGVDSLYKHLDWCVAFQKLCAELTEMSAYVPYTATPGYNADFAEKANALVDAICEDVFVDIRNMSYKAMWLRIVEHAR